MEWRWLEKDRNIGEIFNRRFIKLLFDGFGVTNVWKGICYSVVPFMVVIYVLGVSQSYIIT